MYLVIAVNSARQKGPNFPSDILLADSFTAWYFSSKNGSTIHFFSDRVETIEMNVTSFEAG